jgi:hypothetical protein
MPPSTSQPERVLTRRARRMPSAVNASAQITNGDATVSPRIPNAAPTS